MKEQMSIKRQFVSAIVPLKFSGGVILRPSRRLFKFVPLFITTSFTSVTVPSAPAVMPFTFVPSSNPVIVML